MYDTGKECMTTQEGERNGRMFKRLKKKKKDGNEDLWGACKRKPKD